jgi:hypothetical protein
MVRGLGKLVPGHLADQYLTWSLTDAACDERNVYGGSGGVEVLRLAESSVRSPKKLA